MEKREKLSKRFGKRKRDVDLRILKRLIESPAYPRELMKELGVTRNAIYYHINRFAKYGIVKKLRDNRYAFVGYFDEEEAVVQVVNKWKSIAFRYPTVSEIANETGLKIEDAERLAYKTRDRTGWFAPNEAIIESSREKLGEVLVCATYMRNGKVNENGQSEDFDYKDDMEIVEEAKRFLKEHPEMLPKIKNDDEVLWPEEALKYLGKNYKPKDRSIPYASVVSRG
ncbi:MAG: winged helix-turn-helix domain-containing protein [Candidatus Bathyarchaeia archaeon]